ncbi:MAG TPA: MFS transporter [Trebonia sp.]|nr:MFS transporter [Trebonia sp.]
MSQTRAVSRRGTRLAASVRSGPLGIPAFRLLTAGQFTSTIGDFCYAVALPWLVLSNHGSAAQLGVVLACYGIPRAVLTVPGGSLADRFGPRRVMLGSDAVRCALTAVFAVLAASHVSSLAALAPVAAVLGACAALFLPASAALMPTLVDAERLPTANAVYTGSLQFGMLFGPVIGGVLVAATGTTAAFGVDSASYAVSAASLALMAATGRRRSPAGESAGLAPGPGAAGAGSAGAGSAGAGIASAAGDPTSVWVLLRQARLLQLILAVSLTANFALIGTTEVALPSLAHARFGADGYGAVLTCLAVGSLAGTLVVARVGRRIRPAALLSGAFFVAAIAIALAPFLGGLPGLAGAILVFGVALGIDNVLSITVLQQWAPPAMLGRVMGLIMVAAAASFPLSTALAGLLTRHLGPAPLFPLTGAMLGAAILGALSQREFRAFGVTLAPDTPEGLTPDPAAS